MQILEKKTQQEDIEENFESKFQITNGNYVSFKTSVDLIYKNSGEFSSRKTRFYQIINSKSEMSSIVLQQGDKLPFWIDNKDLMCNCPKMKLKRKYLIMTKTSNLLKYLPTESKETTSDEIAYETEDVNEESETTTKENFVTTKNIEEATPANLERIVKRYADSNIVSRIELTSEKIAGLLVDRETVIIEWRPEFNRRLRRFVKLFKNGRCS